VLPRSSRDSGILRRWATHLGWVPALLVVMGLGLSGCSSETTTPSPTAPARPPQAAAASPAASAPAPKPAAPLYAYEAKGRRDPFLPLIAPRVPEVGGRSKPTGLAALQVNELKLAGIVWEQRGFFALVEAPNGAGYVLRVNDTVGGGARVTSITPQAVTFEVRIGVTRGEATPSQPTRTRMVELRLRKEE
jgi:Tfp pilus assembly protein PilP